MKKDYSSMCNLDVRSVEMLIEMVYPVRGRAGLSCLDAFHCVRQPWALRSS